ncbi:MAG: hypothetical protein QNJ15_14275 [Erythrobacter sp.]|nr:hypothetical protein [Erythrobacter sp.]
MKGTVISAALLAMAVTSVPALASGSGSRGGGGFGGGGLNNGSGLSRVSQEDRLHRRGKSQVRKRITCKKCEYHKRLNKQTAGEVATAVRNGKFDLKDNDRTAVLYYLRQRYGV